jgi:hemerythrin-like domain-containing protein
MADRCENDGPPNAQDVEGVLNLLRAFADGYHQGKEESVLFPALMCAGMTRETAPLRPLLFEHDQERSLIGGIQEALFTHRGKDFIHYAERLSGILSTHIYKEENILFEMADKVLTADQKARIEKQFMELEANLKPEISYLVEEKLRDLEWRYLGKAA